MSFLLTALRGIDVLGSLSRSVPYVPIDFSYAVLGSVALLDEIGHLAEGYELVSDHLDRLRQEPYG